MFVDEKWTGKGTPDERKNLASAAEFLYQEAKPWKQNLIEIDDTLNDCMWDVRHI